MKNYLLFLAACMCMAFTCHPEESDTFHRSVRVTNNVDYPVYVTFEWVEQWHNPEESLKFPWNPSENKSWNWNSENRVNPDETNVTAIVTIRGSIEGYMVIYKHMKVFFIDAEKFDAIPMGSPIPDEVLLDSRVYDLEDLRAINFHIHYPLEPLD